MFEKCWRTVEKASNSRRSVRALPSCLWCGLVAGLALAAIGHPETVSSLYSRGYTVLPEPQQVKLGQSDFELSAAWRVEVGPGVPPGDVAVETLREELKERYGLKLDEHGSGPAIRLAIRLDSVSVGDAQDRDKAALAGQAYKLTLAKDGITIVANAPAGLFYGAETLVQMVKVTGATLSLPEAELVDWPDLPPLRATVEDLRREDVWVAEVDGALAGVLGVEEGEAERSHSGSFGQCARAHRRPSTR